MGRSTSRAVRMAVSEGRPSRRKKPPGILPAAYMRSSMSTVSGKKSNCSFGSDDATAVTSTCVSPSVIRTAPSARPARRPPSIRKTRPSMSRSSVCGWMFAMADEPPGSSGLYRPLCPAGRFGSFGQYSVVSLTCLLLACRSRPKTDRLASHPGGWTLVLGVFLLPDVTEGRIARPPTLPPDPQALDHRSILRHILAADVFEQPLSLPDHLEQTTPGVVVLAVGLEVLRQVVD